MQCHKSVAHYSSSRLAMFLISFLNARPCSVLTRECLIVGLLLHGVLELGVASGEHADKQLQGETLISEDCPFNITARRGAADAAAASPRCRCSTLNEVYCQNLDAVPRLYVDDHLILDGLYMTRQGIHELPQGAFSNINVYKISLNFNPIRDVISESAFSGLGRHLRELQLGRCQIQTLPPGLLTGLDQLTRLHLWGNQIQRIPPAFFKNVRNLTELLLWGNQIREVDENTFAGLWKLRRLDLDRNGISSLNKEVFRHLSDLRLLYLGENSLRELYGDTFEYMRNLRVLNLDGNGLGFLYVRTFFGLNNLLALALHNNKIGFIPDETFAELKNLSIVWLSNNMLQFLWPKTFGGLRSLLQIHLRDNQLKLIPDGVFRHSPKLRQLFLEGNELQGLAKCVLPKRRPRTISLVGNPLDCDCRLAWLVEVHEAGGTVWGSCAPEEGSRRPRPLLQESSYRVEESCTADQLPECFTLCKTGFMSSC